MIRFGIGQSSQRDGSLGYVLYNPLGQSTRANGLNLFEVSGGVYREFSELAEHSRLMVVGPLGKYNA
jgi:hypothetical protein